MSDLAEILHSKLIPWARQDVQEHFIVARPKMSAADMPDGVRLVRHPITGKRKVVKGRRNYRNTRGTVALWPGMGLNEASKLKLVCVLNGHIKYQLGSYKLRCGAGNFIFIPPGTPHPDGTQSYVDMEKSTFCDLLFFVLHPNAIEYWISHFDERGRVADGQYLILQESALLTFRALMEEVMGGDEKSLLSGEALLSAFLIILQREVNAGRALGVKSSAADYLNDDEFSKADFSGQLTHYVLANLQKPLTLEKVARDLFLSRAQFTRTVRRETGKSFNEFLAACRMEEAGTLLRDSEWTISTIAAFVGFKSPSYFRTFFKETTGKTPSEYRDSHRKAINHKNVSDS